MTRFALALAAAVPLAAHAASAQTPAPAPYFQQGVAYRIEATLNEATSVLSGRARLRYENRSRTTLDTLYVHQHLNAFRPNSRWARRELEYGQRRFTDLGPADHAYERFRGVTVGGQAVTPVYPGAPDSTVAAIPLPRPLAPGQSVVLDMDWDARLSTLPRRQGRAGRHYDFAQWYPRIAVFDPRGWQQQALHPQGEFYGEVGSYDVTLEVAADQVVGATGVLAEGDAGWQNTPHEAAAYPAMRGAPGEALGLLSAPAGEGRKRLRFVADSVHHFAWLADPTFRADVVSREAWGDAGGRETLPSIRVLYLPADTGWGGNVVAKRTYDALAFMQSVFGPYAWPQLTVAHRLESGGTEFPMLVMNGSNGEGLVVHEVAHQWTHGMLANNEWAEGWLDEGFASFLTNWYWEEKGNATVWNGVMDGLAAFERSGAAQPLSLAGPQVRDPRTYSLLTYNKGGAVLRMLREMLGEETFRRGTRLYFERHRLQHVTPADFQRAMEDASRRDLDWFFTQWIERTDRLDYGITRATSVRAGNRWRTTVEVLRAGDAWMPVTVQVGDATRTLDSRARRQTVTVVTSAKPAEVLLDPKKVLLDFDRSNDRAAVP